MTSGRVGSAMIGAIVVASTFLASAPPAHAAAEAPPVARRDPVPSDSRRSSPGHTRSFRARSGSCERGCHGRRESPPAGKRGRSRAGAVQ